MTVQLPLYNEQNVVERLIDACAALDYPADRLHIQVLDDSTDDTVALAAARVAHHAAQGLHISHVRRPDRDGYKAGALRLRPHPYRGRVRLPFSTPTSCPSLTFCAAPCRISWHAPDTDRIGVVQTRWGHLNEDESLLTAPAGLWAERPLSRRAGGPQRGGHFINFNGTGGIWRRACIDDAGGWHTDTLTEDLDLSYRAQLRGWRFRYLPRDSGPRRAARRDGRPQVAAVPLDQGRGRNRPQAPGRRVALGPAAGHQAARHLSSAQQQRVSWSSC